MSKYTETELKDECLAWASQYSIALDPSRTFDKWWAERNKPAKKIIDLIPLLESGIDCEFKNADNDTWRSIGPLSCAAGPVRFPYQRKGMGTVAWQQCRPRMNHKMCHDGSKPIEGFVVKVYFNNTSAILTVYRGDAYWANVTAIEYLRVDDGYAYPWEQAE